MDGSKLIRLKLLFPSLSSDFDFNCGFSTLESWMRINAFIQMMKTELKNALEGTIYGASLIK